jgi:hypothetical protein
MKRLLVLLALLILVVPATAQEAERDPVIVALVDEANTVMVYIEATDLNRVVLQPEDIPEGADITARLSPDGDYLAVLIRQVSESVRIPLDLNGQPYGESGLRNEIIIFSLPDGVEVYRGDVLADDYVLEVESFVEDSATGFSFDTITRGGGLLSWSPDGSRLMWVQGTANQAVGELGIFDTPTADVTVLDMFSGVPYAPEWSPDGAYAVFPTARNFGTGAGPSPAGVFVLGPDNTVNPLPLDRLNPSPEIANSPVQVNNINEQIDGWLDDQTYVFTVFSLMAGGAGLFTYDPIVDDLTTILPLEQDSVASITLGPAGESITIVLSEFMNDLMIERGALPGGVYFLADRSAEPESTGLLARFVIYLDADTLYVLENTVYDIPTGEIRELGLPSGRFILQPDGRPPFFRPDESDVTSTLRADGSVVELGAGVPVEVIWLDDTAFAFVRDGELFVRTLTADADTPLVVVRGRLLDIVMP